MNDIMTAKEVAEFLRIHQTTLYRHIREQKIPFFKLGSDYRFHRAAILAWVEQQGVDGVK